METPLPTVSVVLEGNTDVDGRLVSQAVESVARQSYPRDLIELVLMDASPHGTVGQRVRQMWPGAVVVPASTMKYYEMKNRGAEASSGELVAFLDSDVRYEPGWISSAVESLQHLPRYSAVVGLTAYAPGLFSKAGTVTQFGHHWSSYASGQGDPLLGVIANNFAIRRDDFVRVPYRFTAFRQGMDMVLASDLTERGGTVLLNPMMRVSHKWGWSKIWEHPQTANSVGYGLLTALRHCDHFIKNSGAMNQHVQGVGLSPKVSWLLSGSIPATLSVVGIRYLLFSNYMWRTRRVLGVKPWELPVNYAFLTAFFAVVAKGAVRGRHAQEVA